MRDKIKELLYRYRHGWILSYLIIYQMWFIYVERTVTRRFHIVHTVVDDYIPFVEVFIVDRKSVV